MEKTNSLSLFLIREDIICEVCAIWKLSNQAEKRSFQVYITQLYIVLPHS